MTRTIGLLIIILSLLVQSNIYAANLEKVSFISPKKSDKKYTITGYFSKPGLIAPNETIFSVREETIGNPLYSLGTDFIYSFLGRTGEKTFEMRYKLTSSIYLEKKR